MTYSRGAASSRPSARAGSVRELGKLGKLGKLLSNMAMPELLQGMRSGDRLTIHGLRSSFRDWAAETGCAVTSPKRLWLTLSATRSKPYTLEPTARGDR